MGKNQIVVCGRCEEPLVWTFMFDGAEYYCPCCGLTAGAFGGETEEVDETPELKRREKIISDYFKKLRDDIIPARCQYKNCKKCDADRNSYHIDHASKKAVEKSKKAKEELFAHKVIYTLLAPSDTI